MEGSPIPFEGLVEFGGKDQANCHGEATVGFGDKSLMWGGLRRWIGRGGGGTLRQSNSNEINAMATVETSIPRKVQPTRATFFTFRICSIVKRVGGGNDLAECEGLRELWMPLTELLVKILSVG